MNWLLIFLQIFSTIIIFWEHFELWIDSEKQLSAESEGSPLRRWPTMTVRCKCAHHMSSREWERHTVMSRTRVTDSQIRTDFSTSTAIVTERRLSVVRPPVTRWPVNDCHRRVLTRGPTLFTGSRHWFNDYGRHRVLPESVHFVYRWPVDDCSLSL